MRYLLFLGTILCPIVSVAAEETSPVPSPVMSEFYKECLRAKAVPGTVFQESVLYYKGPQYFFSIWTPLVENPGNLSLEVKYRNHYNIPPSPTPPNKYISVKLNPGESTTFASDEIFLGKEPRSTKDNKVEYCIQINPVINLENIGTISLSK